jgi:drug/metabolite transporter (DMT)-like permease
MIAVLGGLGAALAWALSTFCSSSASRLIEPSSAVAWALVAGVCVSAPPALLEGLPARLAGPGTFWLLAAGASNAAGLVLAYRAVRVGKVLLAAPLASSGGAVAAVIAVISGESVSRGVAAALVVIGIGVCLATVSGDRAASDAGRIGEAVLAALLAACMFGISLYALARASSLMPATWTVLSVAVVGAASLAPPLAVRGRMHLPRRALPWVITPGVFEVLGSYSYIAGARQEIAVAAVLSSQFAALAALAGWIFYRERLRRLQLVGVCAVIIGVAAVSGLQA